MCKGEAGEFEGSKCAQGVWSQHASGMEASEDVQTTESGQYQLHDLARRIRLPNHRKPAILHHPIAQASQT